MAGDEALKTVLIVDDEAPTRMLMRTAVEGAGFPCQVVEASDGDAALKLAADLRPDLILLDIVLPGSASSGVLVCNQLCKDSRNRVVIVSGQANKTIVQACLNAGARDYIRKPFAVEAFQEQVRGWLSE
jgi:CheY-like chemotaxis protein